MLTEVHRQARDDPIVQLSMQVREGQRLVPGEYGQTSVVTKDAFDPQRALETDQILVGRNNTRRAYNARLRERKGFNDPMPLVGRQAGVPAQQPPQGPVQRRPVERRRAADDAKADPEAAADRRTKVTPARASRSRCAPECFTGAIDKLDWPARKKYDEFDFGYVLTVHKAQGSQWDDVVLFDESYAFQDSRDRWLYTGITRAAKRLTVVV